VDRKNAQLLTRGGPGLDTLFWRPTLSDVLVRLLLLAVFALTSVSGRPGAGIDVVADDGIELVELAGEEAILGAAIELPSVARSALIPRVRKGTEVTHPSPELARVFRPPRVSVG
jgi:hypothetical protein